MVHRSEQYITLKAVQPRLSPVSGRFFTQIGVKTRGGVEASPAP